MRPAVDIRFYNIIYNLIDEVKQAMTGLLAPVFQDVTDGYAEVRETFKLPERRCRRRTAMCSTARSSATSRARVLAQWHGDVRGRRSSRSALQG